MNLIKNSYICCMDDLKPEHKRFCEEYIYDFNATRAYMKAYPNSDAESARRSGSRLLTNADVKAYIDELQADLGKTAGISRLKVLREYEKLAFNGIAHLHNTWIERKEFEELTDAEKACIAEISTQTKTVIEKGKPAQVEFIKVKLHDKQKALDSINKMLGYNEPEKVEHSGKVDIPIVEWVDKENDDE